MKNSIGIEKNVLVRDAIPARAPRDTASGIASPPAATCSAEAITTLSKVAEQFPESADTQNFLGYAHRQSGDLDAAFTHYQRALEIDPMHRHAHEYLGEAYLMKSDVDSAEEHLAELAKICAPIPCEEYKQLKRAVDAYKSQ